MSNSGGLIQVVSKSHNDLLLTGNPSKTFFKSTYAKYTNFALQKFKLDFEGTPGLNINESSSFTFKVKRYADLLMDLHLCITLPNIYSPIAYPCQENDFKWVPYEFKWIPFIGAMMIENIRVSVGSQLLQEFSGDYILNVVERDFSTSKKDLFYRMIGHIPELNDPGNSGSRVNTYPNCYYTDYGLGAEPSIRSRDLYIPLNLWFMLKSSQAFPLVALQYNELEIQITLRPVKEWFTIRDVYDAANNFPYVSPNLNLFYMQMYWFLQTPPQPLLNIHSYTDKRTQWNSKISLLATYCFLSTDEAHQFAIKEHTYLLKQVKKDIFYNVSGATKVRIDSINMVPNIMFYLQRSDANLRNEWHNYTNWPYSYMPSDLVRAPTKGILMTQPYDSLNDEMIVTGIGPGMNFDEKHTGLMLTGNYTMDNENTILRDCSFLFNGSYREDTMPSGVYNYVEKYTRSQGNGKDGLFCYNFCINTAPDDLQPSGAVNFSKFNRIEIELTTIVPGLDPNYQTTSVCEPDSGNVVGIIKKSYQMYDYTFNLYVFQERYNWITFTSGNCGLAYAT